MFTYWTRRDKVALSLRIFFVERPMVVVDNSHDAKMLWSSSVAIIAIKSSPGELRSIYNVTINYHK